MKYKRMLFKVAKKYDFYLSRHTNHYVFKHMHYNATVTKSKTPSGNWEKYLEKDFIVELKRVAILSAHSSACSSHTAYH